MHLTRTVHLPYYIKIISKSGISDVFLQSLQNYCNNLTNTSEGISTFPNLRRRALPFFCFSKSFRLRVTSPPYNLAVTSLRKGEIDSEAIIFPPIFT